MEALDDIVNAVTEIVLVFEEAQSDLDTHIVVKAENLGVLIHAVSEMIAEKNHIANQIEDLELRNSMLQSNSQIQTAILNLENIIRSQPGGVIQRSAYKGLHAELRTLLLHMVHQLQITDQVNVGILMKATKRCLDCFARLKNADNAGALVVVAREASKSSIDLQIHLKARIAEITALNLRQRLADAAEALRTGAPLVINACQAAIEAPSADTVGKRDRALRLIIEALQEIFTVTQASAKYVSEYTLSFGLPELTAKPKSASMHSTGDYGAHRAPRVDAELTRLEDAVRRRDQAAATAAAKSLVDEVDKQVKQGREYANTMKGAQQREALLRDLQELERLTPQIVQATKAVLVNPNDKKAQDHFQSLVNQARNVNDRINDAKKPEKAFIDSIKELDALIQQLTHHAKTNQADAAVRDAKEMAEQMTRQIELARNAAKECKNPAHARTILEACEQLEKLMPLLVKAIKDVLANPGDAAAQARLDDIVKQIKDQEARIARAILEDQLEKNNELVKSQLAALHQAALRGDSAGAAEILKDLADSVTRRIELGRELAAQTKDPVLRKQILDACDALERMLPELVVATREVLQNPNDAAAQKRLADLIEEMKKESDRITAARVVGPSLSRMSSRVNLNDYKGGLSNKNADTLGEEIISNANSLDHSIEGLRDAVARGDHAAAAAAAREVASQINKQIELGRALAAKCDDPVLKKKILDACDDLENLVPQIVAATKDALMNPNDKQAKQRLDSLLDRAKAANKVIADAADQLRSQNKKLDDIASNMANKMNLVDNKLASEFKPDGSRDEIMVAAHQVSNATREAAAPVIPEQKNLLDIASAIAAEMEKLSLAAQKKSKKDMIESARKIAGMIGQIQGFAGEISAKCTDPILREQLLSISRVPKNFAVQLKIISAVKATSSEDDPSTELQLVTCAKGLANSVVQTVKAAEAASLRCPRA